jgi:hypothetical protein
MLAFHRASRERGHDNHLVANNKECSNPRHSMDWPEWGFRRIAEKKRKGNTVSLEENGVKN